MIFNLNIERDLKKNNRKKKKYKGNGKKVKSPVKKSNIYLVTLYV